MKNYSVIRVSGKQYKVTVGQEILVDKIKIGKVEPEVLLKVLEDKVKIGEPVLALETLKLKVVSEEEKGEKVHVRTYKAKSRHRRHIGFRPKFTRLLIEKL